MAVEIALIAFDDFLSPLQTSRTSLKSYLTVPRSVERTLHSLSRNLNNGFLTRAPTLFRV